MDERIKGIVVAMVTPFESDESLDEEGLRQIVRFLLDRRVHGLFPGGSQGEFYALTTAERCRVLEITVEAAKGKAFVVGHVGATTCREATYLARHAQDVGADAIAAITPYFITPSQDELYAYYAELAASVNLPLFAYDNPGRTGVHLTPGTVARLAHNVLNFGGIKDSSGDLGQFAEYIRLCPPGFGAFIGRDSLIYGALMYGGIGAVAATANVVPELTVGIYDAVVAGDLERARALQRQLAPLRTAFSLGTFPAVIKEAMQILGLPAGRARGPIQPLAPDNREQLRRVLRQVGAKGRSEL
jgi:4-hydroxy-tetrahydrodipicolinate synthase